MGILAILALILFLVMVVIGIARNEYSGMAAWFYTLVGTGILSLLGASFGHLLK